jgi:hypothetical protein
MVLNEKVLFYLKVGTNILLSILLLITLITILNYRQEVNEALGLESPARLLKIYEDKNGLVCSCYNPYSEDIKIEN